MLRAAAGWMVAGMACGALGCAAEPTAPSVVESVLAIDANCIVHAEDNGPAVGLYDVGGMHTDVEGATASGCGNPYMVALRLNAHLAPAILDEYATREGCGPGPLQVQGVRVELRDATGSPLDFGSTDLPNPFEAVTTHNHAVGAPSREGYLWLVALEAIPTAYARQLGAFVDDEVQVRLEVEATIRYGEPVPFEPFDYPVELCAGCLTVCMEADLHTQPGTSLDTALGGQCYAPSLGGMDDRLCVDQGC